MDNDLENKRTPDAVPGVDAPGATAVPAGEIPAQEIPSEEVPAQEIPVEEVPAQEIPAEGQEPSGEPYVPTTPADRPERYAEYNEVFEDTLYFVNGIVSEYRFYPEILSMIRGGKTTVQMSRDRVKKHVSTDWVEAIEACLPDLDRMVRNPGRTIEQLEEVLPIELSRHITSRSIQHLGQHTDYINDIDEKGNITPSKILNVFNEETLQTYENKFLNTLLMRLSSFVARRFDRMFAAENLENCSRLSFTTDFARGLTHGKMTFAIELGEPADSDDARPGEFSLSDRVRHIRDVVMGYMSSPFVKAMGRSYIRPPVMRTNAIMKNKHLRACLVLWQFIEGYEGVGLQIEHEQQALCPDEKYIDELYSTLALQYVIFQHNIGSVPEEKNMTPRRSDKVYREPDYVFDVEDVESRDFCVYDTEYRRYVNIDSPLNHHRFSEDERKIQEAIEAALLADEFYRYPEEDEEREIDPSDIYTAPDGRKIRVRYRRSFEAKLIQSSDATKDYYNLIRNWLLSYERVQSRVSFSHERFYVGRRTYARFAVAGKTLNVYLAMDPAELEGTKYIYTDASDVRKYADTPVRLKIRSNRSAKWACELITVMLLRDGLTQGPIPGDVRTFPYEQTLSLIARGLVHMIGTDIATGETVEEDELKRLMGILPDTETTAPEQEAMPEAATATPEAEEAASEAATATPEAEEVASEAETATPKAEEAASEAATATPKAEEAASEAATAAPDTAEAGTAVPESVGDETPDAFALYRRSFRAKLIQSDDEVKEWYRTVHTHLLSYGMKFSESWDSETFHIGRKRYAMLGILGKTLILYLALDPAEFAGSKYFFEDASGTGKYRRTPFKFKIRSDRAVHWALELIDAMCFADSLSRLELPLCDPIPTESTEALIRRGLIRVNKEKLAEVNASLESEPVPVTEAAEPDPVPMSGEEYGEMRAEGLLPDDREDVPSPVRAETEEREDAEETEEAEAGTAPAAAVVGGTGEGAFAGTYIRRSFRGKLCQASEDTKEYYTRLCELLLSYPKMKLQESFDNDTFHFERNRYARMSFSGKTLSLYLALNPDDYADTKYFFNDCSGTKKYERTPLRMRIRTRRALQWAEELIADMAQKHGFGDPEEVVVPVQLPDRTDEELYDLGLARVDLSLLASYVAAGDEDAIRMDAHIRGQSQPPAVGGETLADGQRTAAVGQRTVPAGQGTVPAEQGTAIPGQGTVSAGQDIPPAVPAAPDGEETPTAATPAEPEEIPAPVSEFLPPRVVWRKSFEAALIMSSDVVKDYYMTLRNVLLSYTGVRARGQFSGEIYRCGRARLAMFVIRGKTLNLYLALDPASLAGTKYIWEDASRVRKYERTPTRLRIRSPRAARWAGELIARMMAERQISMGEPSEEYFDIPMEDFESLCARGLIREARAFGTEKTHKIDTRSDASRDFPTAEAALDAPALTVPDAPEEPAAPAADTAPSPRTGEADGVAPADGDEEPEENAPADGDEEPEENAPADGDGEPEENAPADGDEEPEENAPADGDEEPEENAPADGDEEPEENAPTDGDEEPEEETDDADGGRGFMAHFRKIFRRKNK